jgi:site-specific DNA recombinase
MKKTGERKVVGYVRVSTDEQKKSGLSIENQEERIKAYATMEGVVLERIYKDEAFSGGSLKRPAVTELLERVGKGDISMVIILKLDRMTRSLSDLLDILHLFEQKEAALNSLSEKIDTSTAAGKLMIHIIGVVAEWERGAIAERIRAAFSVKRSRKEKLGGIVPFGYKAVGDGAKEKKTLVPMAKEQAILKGILEARGEGRGYADIAQGLNQMGVKPRSGAAWYASTIRSICLREAREAVPTGGNT